MVQTACRRVILATKSHRIGASSITTTTTNPLKKLTRKDFKMNQIVATCAGKSRSALKKKTLTTQLKKEL